MMTTTLSARVCRVSVTAVSLAAVVSMLAACGGGRAGVSGHPAPSTNTTANMLTSQPGTPTSSAAPKYATVNVDPGSDAAKTFGRAAATRGVQAAYSVVAHATSMDQLLAPGQHPSRLYQPVQALLTPRLWRQVAAAADAGDPHGIASALVLTADTQGRIVINRDGVLMSAPRVMSVAVGGWTAGVNRQPGTTRLAVHIPVTVTYTGDVDGQTTRAVLRTTYTLDLVPSGKTAWLLDAYRSITVPVSGAGQ